MESLGFVGMIGSKKLVNANSTLFSGKAADVASLGASAVYDVQCTFLNV